MNILTITSLLILFTVYCKIDFSLKLLTQLIGNIIQYEFSLKFKMSIHTHTKWRPT